MQRFLIYRSAFADINIHKGRPQIEGRSFRLAVLFLCLNLGALHLTLSKKKQAGLEIARCFECALKELCVAMCSDR